METIRATFFQECEELLADLESGLLAMEAGEGDGETVNAVFRAVHSVKGGAGAFGLEALVRFAHVFETALDEMRAGRLPVDPDSVKVMLRAADVLADHVQAAKTGQELAPGHGAASEEELGSLIGHDAAADAGGEAMEEIEFTPVAFADAALPVVEAPPAPARRRWRVAFRPAAAMYAKANDPLLLLRELARLGDCEVVLDTSGLPPLEALNPEEAYLAWEVVLATDAAEAAVREVFEFVEGDCTLEIQDLDGDDGGDGEAAPADFDIASLISQFSTPASELAALEGGDGEPAAEAPQPEPAAKPAPAAPAPTPAAPVAAPAAAAKPEAPAATIRVDLERVDRLIDLVGELVINQAMLAQRVAESGLTRSSTIAVGLDDLEQLTREIQDSVMAIRAQPVKSVFQRMPRLVREVAAMTGKQVRLVTEGETTEVDKTVIERLSEPITHMLRNAIDHGLETPEERIAAGKPAEGVVRLAALHRSGRIVIEVSDDGKGINRQRVRQIAVDRGLIDPEAQLSDDEVDNLIFLPGFSTASSVSDISGRGVGMDVVKRSITALGGRISITSQPGQGSTFTMSLPLTLAVLDGMVVSVGDQTLVAPLTAIIETLQPRPGDIREFGAAGKVMAVRDSYVPVIDVARALGWKAGDDLGRGVVLLVESELGGRAALMVDGIQGQRQVVIKSLEANYRQVEGIAAATILGDGRVALILDIDALLSACRRESGAPLQTFAQAS